MQAKPKILGLILSGGAGTRAGGRDKGLIAYRAKPLVQHVVEILGPQVEQLVIAAHRNQRKYQSITPWVVVDLSADHEGPMAGIMALINELHSKGETLQFDYIAVSSCDTPHIPRDYVERLVNAIDTPRVEVAVTHDGMRRQNLHCLITASALPSLIEFYESGGRAMHRWFEKVNTLDVDFSTQPEKFKNLNSLEQIS